MIAVEVAAVVVRSSAVSTRRPSTRRLRLCAGVEGDSVAEATGVAGAAADAAGARRAPSGRRAAGPAAAAVHCAGRSSDSSPTCDWIVRPQAARVRVAASANSHFRSDLLG